MSRHFIHFTTFLLSLAVVSGCNKTNWQTERFFCPANYVLGQENETMLWTEYATLDITTQGKTADLLFSFKGKDIEDSFTIPEFVFEIRNVSRKTDGGKYSIEGSGLRGVVTYTKSKKTESIIRSFNLSGILNLKNPSLSNVTISAEFLDRLITLSLKNLTQKESEAEFGKQGYPSWSGGMLNTKRIFANNSGHDVSVGYQAGSFVNDNPVFIKSGTVGKFVMIEVFDTHDSSFVLTFDDGRVSKHTKNENRFEYNGLPAEIKPAPFLSFNSGIIYFEDNYDITYTITSEIYAGAVTP